MEVDAERLARGNRCCRQMSHQDWLKVVIGGGRSAVSRPAVIQPRRDGGEAARLAKLAENPDPPTKPKLLSRESVTKIVEYRRTNKLTQKQLDQQLAFPPNTTNKLESYQIGPAPAQLNSLNRVLKTGLTLE